MVKCLLGIRPEALYHEYLDGETEGWKETDKASPWAVTRDIHRP